MQMRTSLDGVMYGSPGPPVPLATMPQRVPEVRQAEEKLAKVVNCLGILLNELCERLKVVCHHELTQEEHPQEGSPPSAKCELAGMIESQEMRLGSMVAQVANLLSRLEV